MLNQLKNEANITYTENGAVTYASSGSYCLDFFGTVGALRREDSGEIITRFIRAYAENPDLAMKILFFARDVRGGLGERRVFRVILQWLCHNEPESVYKNISRIAEYGRYDDLLVLLDTPLRTAAVGLIRDQLCEDLDSLERGGAVSLMAKWLPSVNASNKDTVRLAKRLARQLGMTDAEYRRTLVKLRAAIRLIENSLRERDYTFDYSKQPSGAMFKYRSAFIRNDGERYADFMGKVNKGEATLHTGTLAPYEIIAPAIPEFTFFGRGKIELSGAERAALDATWNSLEDFTRGENALAVVDGSGSMYGSYGKGPSPISVALSLGIYFAERNRGAFRNRFITFSSRPKLVEIKGRDIAEKVRFCAGFNEVANTDIKKVFELILKTAVKNGLPKEELPETLYIISDMEFDDCMESADETNFEYAKGLYGSHGYRLPKVIFWNVASRNRQQPVTANEQGVALVSGCTPRIFSMVTSGELSPMAYMMEVLGGERYRDIAA